MKRGPELEDVAEESLIYCRSVSPEIDRLLERYKLLQDAIELIREYLENDISAEKREEFEKMLRENETDAAEVLSKIKELRADRNRVLEFEEERRRQQKEAERRRKILDQEKETIEMKRAGDLLEEGLIALNLHRDKFAERFMESKRWSKPEAETLYRQALQLIRAYRTIEDKEKAINQLRKDLREVISESTNEGEEGEEEEILDRIEIKEQEEEEEEEKKEREIVEPEADDIIIEEPVVSWSGQLGGQEVNISKSAVRKILVGDDKPGKLTDDIINGFMLALRKTLSPQTRDLWFFFPVQVSRILFGNGNREETVPQLKAFIDEVKKPSDANDIGTRRRKFIMPVEVDVNQWIILVMELLDQKETRYEADTLLIDIYDTVPDGKKLTNIQLSKVAVFIGRVRGIEERRYSNMVFPKTFQKGDKSNSGVFMSLFLAVIFAPIDVRRKDTLLRRVSNSGTSLMKILLWESRQAMNTTLQTGVYDWSRFSAALDLIESVNVPTDNLPKYTIPLGSFSEKDFLAMVTAITDSIAYGTEKTRFDSTWKTSKQKKDVERLGALSQSEIRNLTLELTDKIYGEYAIESAPPRSVSKEEIGDILGQYVSRENFPSSELSSLIGGREALAFHLACVHCGRSRHDDVKVFDCVHCAQGRGNKTHGMVRLDANGGEAYENLIYRRDSDIYRDTTRNKWLDHVLWMRFFVVSFLAGLDDLTATQDRLWANQREIAQQFLQYESEEAQYELQNQLEKHVLDFVRYTSAVKSNSDTGIVMDLCRKRARAIARVLYPLNDTLWTVNALEKEFLSHINMTLHEIDLYATNEHEESISEFIKIQDRIMATSDRLCNDMIEKRNAGLSQQ